MAISPTESDSLRTLALIQAFGEIMGLPAAQLAVILAKARTEMGGP